MTENENAPHVKELARALNGEADEEKIAQLMDYYTKTMKLKPEQAKRMVIKTVRGHVESGDAPDRGGGGAGGDSRDRKLDALALEEKGVNILARVVHVTEREIEAKGEKKRIFSGILGDDTTTRPFTAWDASAVKLSKGDVVRLENAYTTAYKGEPQVNIGNWTKVVPMPASALPKGGRRSEPKKISELQDAMSGIGLCGRVISVERREVTVGTEKKAVFSGTLADKTGKVMFSAWYDFGIKEGEAIRVSGGYTKSWRGMLQFNFDDRSQIERIDDFPSAKELSKPVMQTIERLDKGGGVIDVEVRGLILDVRPGSGLIFRCPECNRVLQASSCSKHNEVEGEPDLRIKAIFDDGTGAMTIVCGREVTEKMLGKGMDAIMKEVLGKKVVNYDSVRDKLAEQLIAKPVLVRGNVTNDEFGLMLVGTEMQILSMDVAEEARKMLADEEGAQ